VRQENRDLKAQIELLRLEQARLIRTQPSPSSAALLGFKEQSILQTIAAQVVGSSGSEQSRSLFLDKGADDGLKKNMAVITAKGWLERFCRPILTPRSLLLINDQTSGLGAIVERLRLQGIVRGSPNGETMLEKVMADEEVQPGDKVITTGGDGIFPKGLPVGSVVKVSSSDLFLKIRLHPAADLSRLEEVLVITKLQDVAPASGEVCRIAACCRYSGRAATGVPEKPASKDAEINGAPKAEDGKVGDPKVEDPKVSKSRPATSSEPSRRGQADYRWQADQGDRPDPKPEAPYAEKPQPNETLASPRPAVGPQASLRRFNSRRASPCRFILHRFNRRRVPNQPAPLSLWPTSLPTIGCNSVRLSQTSPEQVEVYRFPWLAAALIPALALFFQALSQFSCRFCPSSMSRCWLQYF